MVVVDTVSNLCLFARLLDVFRLVLAQDKANNKGVNLVFGRVNV